MIRRTPTIPAPTPQRWQSRAEIFKAYLESLPPSELLRVRPSYYALHFGWAARKHSYARKAGFDPDQLRVPAGSSEGGQWTSGTGDNDVTGSAGLQPAPYLLVATGTPSVAYCMNQNTIDMLYCSALQPAWYRAACRAQANERLAACLAGKPLPPLPF